MKSAETNVLVIPSKLKDCWNGDSRVCDLGWKVVGRMWILEDFGSGIVFSNDEFLDTTMGVGG